MEKNHQLEVYSISSNQYSAAIGREMYSEHQQEDWHKDSCIPIAQLELDALDEHRHPPKFKTV